MSKQPLTILLFILMAGLTPVIAQQESLSLNMQDAQQYALEFNRLVKNAGLAVNAAQEEIFEAMAMGLPQVNASIDYSNFLGAEIEINFSEDAPPTRIPFNPTSNLAITVGQLIFSGNYIVGLQTARIYKDLVESSYEKTELDIKQQVANSYYTVLVAERSYEIIMQNLDNIKDVYNKTNAMYSVGIAEVTDVDQMAVQVTYLENAAKSAERQIELAYNLLRLQLGVSAETELSLTEGMDDILLRIDFNGTLAEEFDIAGNIDYQMMNTQQLLSQKQINMAKMSYLPSMSGFYSRTEKILKPDFDMTPPNIIGLQMSIPIFSSGSRKSQLDRAKINYETSLNNKELLTDQLLIQEKQLRFNLRSGLEVYESQMKNVEVSRRVYDNINLKYQQGLVSSLDLTTANNNYLQSESGYITALMQLLNAQLELDKLLNNL
ncbi:MAG: TolC family protein [Bacteroidales bacterium]|nr:TolC family protein [Bacteroidales bacterium]